MAAVNPHTPPSIRAEIEFAAARNGQPPQHTPPSGSLHASTPPTPASVAASSGAVSTAARPILQITATDAKGGAAGGMPPTLNITSAVKQTQASNSLEELNEQLRANRDERRKDVESTGWTLLKSIGKVLFVAAVVVAIAAAIIYTGGIASMVLAVTLIPTVTVGGTTAYVTRSESKSKDTIGNTRLDDTIAQTAKDDPEYFKALDEFLAKHPNKEPQIRIKVAADHLFHSFWSKRNSTTDEDKKEAAALEKIVVERFDLDRVLERQKMLADPRYQKATFDFLSKYPQAPPEFKGISGLSKLGFHQDFYDLWLEKQKATPNPGAIQRLEDKLVTDLKLGVAAPPPPTPPPGPPPQPTPPPGPPPAPPAGSPPNPTPPPP